MTEPLTTKEIIIIVAYLTKTFGIGNKGTLPWGKIKADMKRFARETAGHTVIMGRGTWLSLPEEYRPLPGRQNIVVSKTLTSTDVKRKALLATNLSDAVRMASREKIFLIGGAPLFKEAMDTGIVNKILATLVHKELEADCFFPAINGKPWRSVSQENPDIDGPSGIKIQFLTLVNTENPHLSEVF